MWLNCKVIKKCQTPISKSTPPFQVYPPFLAKNFVPPKVTQFLEGLTPPPPPHPTLIGGEGSNYDVTNIESSYDIENEKKRCFLQFKTAYQFSSTMMHHVRKLNLSRTCFNPSEGQESCDSLAKNNFVRPTFWKFGAMCDCLRKNAEAFRNCCIIYLKSTLVQTLPI